MADAGVALVATPDLDILVSAFAGKGLNESQDKMMEHGLSWRFVEINGKKLNRPAEPSPTRVLISVWEDKVTHAELG